MNYDGAVQTTTTLLVEFPQSWNRYSYVGNTPLQAVDPLGLCPGPPCVQVPAQEVGVTSTIPQIPTVSAPIPSSGMSNELAMFIMGAMGGVPSKADQGYCVTENTPINADWRSPNGNLYAADGPYDPDPTGDNCPTSRSGGGGGVQLPSVAPPPPPMPTTQSAAPGVSHCLVAAVEAKGAAILLDAVGSIPAVGNAVSATTGIGRAALAMDHTITAPAFAVAAGAYGSYTAITAGPGEAVDSLVGAGSAGGSIGLALADASLGGTKALPLIGNAVSLITFGWDSYQAIKDYKSCMAGN